MNRRDAEATTEGTGKSAGTDRCAALYEAGLALGRETWVMLPHLGDWRWLLDRDDSPWYPSVRLFRQDATRDFAPAVARVRTELLAKIKVFRA